MARTIQQIKDSIIAEKANHPELNPLNSPSQTAIYNLWMYITAVAMFLHETLWDLFRTELETTINNAAVGTDEWVQNQAFKFQYSTTTPQVISLNNFVPSYNPVDTTLNLISRCSLHTLPNRLVSVKVAKQEPPVPLDPTELSSFKSYLDDISFAGVQYNTISYPSDKLSIKANIYYNGQYSSVITATTINAINTYLSNIPFDGVVRISALEDAIQKVPGISDVMFNNVILRPDSVNFSAVTVSNYMVTNYKEVFYKYGLYSGYVIGENTAGQTLTDTLTFITE